MPQPKSKTTKKIGEKFNSKLWERVTKSPEWANHPNLSKAKNLKARLLLHWTELGPHPKRDDIRRYVARHAERELEEQLGRKPTQDERMFYLKVVGKFIYTEELIKLLEDTNAPF